MLRSSSGRSLAVDNVDASASSKFMREDRGLAGSAQMTSQPEFDPLREANELRSQLASEKRRLAFLFRAGTSQSVGLEGFTGLTTAVGSDLKNDDRKACLREHQCHSGRHWSWIARTSRIGRFRRRDYILVAQDRL